MEFKKYLHYDFETGLITRKIDSKNGVKKGSICGSKNRDGYLSFKFQRKLYLAHRVAWFLHYGEWPKNQIDHINGIKTDNRIENLRDVTASENQRNLTCHRDGKLPGVKQYKNGYISRKTFQGKKIYLGFFKTKEEAHDAFQKFSTREG